MRVLVLHSRYLSGPVSGENRVVEDEVRLLRSAGHDVVLWQPEPRDTRGSGLVRRGASAVWSREAVATVRDVARRLRPDAIHAHNLFPMLSPAVLREAARHAPVFVTLHSYRMMCLPGSLRRDGRRCELCVGHPPWRGVMYRCYRGSAAGSAALAASLMLHRAAGTFDRVTRFLAVSEFVRQKHMEAGMPADQVMVKRNFAWPSERRSGPGDHFLYAGRLAPEKGVDVLLRAWRPELGRLVVVGDGPDRERLRGLASSGVELRPTVPPPEVAALLRGARALVVPSRWDEPSSRVSVEAFAAGVPVIASRVGGVTELVEDDVSGALVEPGSVPALAAALSRLRDPALSVRLGEGAHRLWEREHRPEVALERLLAAYRGEAGPRAGHSG